VKNEAERRREARLSSDEWNFGELGIARDANLRQAPTDARRRCAVARVGYAWHAQRIILHRCIDAHRRRPCQLNGIIL
jgi:hypothetical protein